MADGAAGIPPRDHADDYASHETAESVTVGATVLTPKQVHQRFTADLNSGHYVVVEIGVYPEGNGTVDVERGDFLLTAGPKSDSVRPSDIRDVVAVLAPGTRPPALPPAGDITVHGAQTVGYETGRDPVTGARQSGVYSDTQVGVGIGGDPGGPPAQNPVPISPDPYTIRQELQNKALPEGQTAHPLAGYLYFPKPGGKTKKGAYELTYYGAVHQIHLHLSDKP